MENGAVKVCKKEQSHCILKKMVPPLQQEKKMMSSKQSFYRRPLPAATCTALSSPKGRSFFASAMKNGGLESFFPLMEQHLTQSEPSYCGISTLVVALNALAIDPRRTWKGPWRWYEESMLNCCVDLEQVKIAGITLSTFQCLAICQGLHAEIVYADEYTNSVTEKAFEESFRNAVIEACTEKTISNYIDDSYSESEYDNTMNTSQVLERVLIVSYDRKVVGQTGTGHFSPIAAYDKNSDSVLIMDTARFKYGAHWIQLSLLADAMKPIDNDANRSRGYIKLQKPFDENHEPNESLPVSILLRSEMKSNAARKEFKLYLNDRSQSTNESITLEEVSRFWTKGGTDNNYVWKGVTPHYIPYEDDLELTKSIDGVRALIQYLRVGADGVGAGGVEVPENSNTHPVNTNCRPSRCRTLQLVPQEAIYVIYLACLNGSERKEIILNEAIGSDQIGSLDNSRRQLLAEAELISYAIEVSDQIESAGAKSLD